MHRRGTAGAAVVWRPLVLLLVLVGLHLPGAPGAGQLQHTAVPVSLTAAATSDPSAATQVAEGGALAVVPARATVAGPAPAGAVPVVLPGTPELVRRVVLLLGQLPRPPDPARTPVVLDALRGRAPPASTGT